jgi:hypothetical protein
MDFPRFYKNPRGSNLNNGEVQCLLQYQKGQIKKTEQFKKFIKTDFPSLKKDLEVQL